MESFKYIRNRISEYSRDSLLNITIDVLKKEEIRPSKNFPLFSILTLIKWTLLYGGDKYPSKTADYQLFDKLLKLISEHETFSHFRGKNKYYDFNKVFIVLAHQQFWLQDQLNMTVIWRQLVLYQRLKSKYDLCESFKNKTGLDIIDFFKISFILYVHLNPEKSGNLFNYYGVISNDWINTIDNVTSIRSRNAFLKLLTFGTDESIQRLKKDSQKLKNFELRPFDILFFSQYPIFYFNKLFFVLHKSIFPNTIRHYIYDFLKETDSNFSEEFGKRMEKYIQLGIKEMGVKYISENQFKKIYSNCKNQVDFVIMDNILIESKAIELKTLPSVLPNDGILSNALKDSVVKAYVKQMITVANHLEKQKEFFGIIITYKKLYLGSGLDYWDSFLKNETEEYCQQNNLIKEILPPENLFFIDIDTWDIIVQLIVNKATTLDSLFTYIKEQDMNPVTRKFEIKMHLEKFFPISVNLSFHKEVDELFKFKNNPCL